MEKRMKITGPINTAVRCFVYDTLLIMMLGVLLSYSNMVARTLLGDPSWWGSRILAQALLIPVLPAMVVGWFDLKDMSQALVWSMVVFSPLFWAVLGYAVHKVVLLRKAKQGGGEVHS
jgi:hypothetical protein